ncbi:MAG: hypothetical protein PHV05_02510 [Candidatus Riflebacteria bacterium]|nr:hypothetical protein [Candidatus Riflebacteria bacterium]
MNTIQNQFSIGLDGNYSAGESLRVSSIFSSAFRKSEGASLIRGR